MEHVATEPLSRMTFRSLATSLGVSTYSFVYHFGSRQEMIDAILEEGVRQQTESQVGVDIVAFDREQFRDWYRQAFRHSLRESNRTGLRLQFEAGVLEPIDPDLGERITTAFTQWRETVRSWFAKQGVDGRRATVLAHGLVDAVAGLQFGFLITGDRAATVAAFDLALDASLRDALDG